MRVRMVDVSSETYHIAHRYMIRLKKEGFDDPHELAKYAATANTSLSEFKNQFKFLFSPPETVAAQASKKHSK